MHDEKITYDSLSERQRHVLRTVIQEFVQTAQPVGSAGLVGQYDLGVSPATVRNELAALERMGLLTHPHTSAGRIPTGLGYRFFVHYLVADLELAAEEQALIRRRFQQLPAEVDHWLRASTAGLARTAQSAAVATAPRSVRCTFKHLELVHIQDTKVLLVLVLQEGTVKQQLLDLDQPMEQHELSRTSNELNSQLAGLESSGMRAHAVRLTPFARQVAELAADAMHRIEQHEGGIVFRDGLAEVLRAPEFAESENARRVVQVLEDPELIEQIADDLPGSDTVHVMIAGDGRYAELRDVSLVLSRYGVNDRMSGLLGVLGPVRMRYGRSIGAVRFVSDLMSEKIEKMYGGS